MTSLPAVCAHVVLDALAGWALLAFRRHERRPAETLFLSVMLGMYAETLTAATLLFLGVPLAAAGLATLAAMGTAIGLACRRGLLHLPRPSIGRLRAYEWALAAAVGEKILFALWQTLRTHTYFDDALTHWSGRARSLYGGVNWSLDPSSPVFLAGHVGSRHYPLLAVLWRALTAVLNGGWSEALSRADGLIFFVVIVGTVWLAVLRFSSLRWLAAAAAFTVSAIPLQVWHAAAGYSDIAVEAYAVVALAALLRGEWMIGGVLAAGAAWSKNDGLALYFPALLTATALLPGREPGRMAWGRAGLFCAGFATLVPWLLFKAIHGMGVTPGQAGYGWHPDAPGLLWSMVVTGPTSSIFWVGVSAGVAGTCRAMSQDGTGRALLAVFLIALGSILFVFCFTDAYAFLSDATTIHRSMMQFSAVAILVAAYGIHLRIRNLRVSDRRDGVKGITIPFMRRKPWRTRTRNSER